MKQLDQFILGALVMASALAGVYFLRFWRKTRDRLFVMFAASFWILGVNWLLLAFAKRDEPNAGLYAIRLVAFGLILLAIADKNRTARPGR